MILNISILALIPSLFILIFYSVSGKLMHAHTDET